MSRLISLLIVAVFGYFLWGWIFPPIHQCAKRGDAACVSALLDKDPALLNSTNPFAGGTPLHYAARDSRVDVARVLIQRGASLAATDGVGQTPLHWAASYGNPDIVLLLIRSGAAVNAKSSASQWTPLHLAAKLGRADIVLALLGSGADPALTDKAGNRPSHYATDSAIKNNLEIAAQP